MGDEIHWRVTFFYGYLAKGDKHKSWSLLRWLKDNSSLPWCCIWDFSEVMWAEEQEGGDISSEHQIEGFHDAITSCQHQDLGFIGNKFT